MKKPLPVLIVEDCEDDALLLVRELKNSGYEPQWERVDTEEAMRQQLSARKIDVILSDFAMPSFCGMDALKILKQSGLDIPFIIVSGKIGEETAVQLMKTGAHDYIVKGNLARLVPVIEREITEAEDRYKRRQAEEALRESTERYRRLLESVTNYVYTVRIENGRPVATSHSYGCTQVSGYTPEEYAADPNLWFRMVHKDDCQVVLDQANLVIAGMEPTPLEHRIIHKDGRICWIRNMLVPRHDLEGTLIAYDGIVTDITERKVAEETILNAKQEWERTFDAITDPVMILDIEYRIVKANTALAAKLELTPSEARGLYCYRAIHESHCPPENCPYTRLMADGHSHAMEFMAPHLGGYFSASVSPLVGPDGILQRSICIARNINEQKTLEAQLIHAQKMEAIGQLAGGIAHDFNNILTAIIGFSSILEMEMPENDPGRENIHHVLAAADRAAELTRSLLTFSRKQVINPLPINLNHLVMNVYKFLQRILGEDIELTTSLKHATMTINADSGQIEQVLMNLATNARDAMPSGGTIRIMTDLVELDAGFINTQGHGVAGEYALISVTDTGTGMNEDTINKLFEPFFTTKEVGKGTGLGLSIVYGIIKQHNGFIIVSSEPGNGTTFKIYLPVIRKAVEAKNGHEEESVSTGSETILVADDDPLLLSLLEKILTMFGYAVITAVDGSDAVQKFREHRNTISLVILDIIMPKLNGNEAFEQIRAISPGIRSFFVSGYSADIIHKRGMLYSELEFLTKPVSPMVLLKKVREVLDRSE
ncbi:MAG: hypothetical protein A2076_11995 [Geobacteraceae bacterium GWC2_53_11]|nr:MAG: hypothetical protein A2076_11995 [Geobacteraceae bacterium GWC2_53_11]